MGYRYVQFTTSVILTPIPSSNGVAILWLSTSLTKPSISSVKRILDTINRRESPNVVSLSDCQKSARSFLCHVERTRVSFSFPNVCVYVHLPVLCTTHRYATDFEYLCSLLLPGVMPVLAYEISSIPLVCRYCKPGIEFRSMHTKQCQICTPTRHLTCNAQSRLVPCTSDRDAHCATSEQTVAISFCNNKFIDFGEQCDASAIHTPTASCCSDFTCMLLEGYYVDPACSTICGDGIVAGQEECDNNSDSNCDMATCTKRQ